MAIDDEIDDSKSLSSLGAPKSTPLLADKAINWPPADKINAYNNDLIVAITEVIAGHTILAKNLLISPTNLYGLNPKQLLKNYRKRMGPLPFLCLADAPGRKKEMDPTHDSGGNGREEHAFPRRLIP
jgi:hypothetical protein